MNQIPMPKVTDLSTPDTGFSGGCQCGAVRFRIERLGVASICHCRMCQKAFGGFFAPIVETDGLVWTRGQRALFQSSATNQRGFCADCGTPLTYEYEGSIEIAIGALDNPDWAPPAVQVNAKHRRACFEHLASLPEKSDTDIAKDDIWNASVISYQHPDYES